MCPKSFRALEGLNASHWPCSLQHLFALSSHADNAADAAAGSCCTLLHLAAAMSASPPSALCSLCFFHLFWKLQLLEQLSFALLANACATQITHAFVLALHACCKISYNIRSLFISRLTFLSLLIQPPSLLQRGMTSLFAEKPPQDAGDVPYDAAWGGSPKAHTKDPTPVSADNNSLGKKGAIASGESFEEYLKKRAAKGK